MALSWLFLLLDGCHNDTQNSFVGRGLKRLSFFRFTKYRVLSLRLYSLIFTIYRGGNEFFGCTTGARRCFYTIYVFSSFLERNMTGTITIGGLCTVFTIFLTKGRVFYNYLTYSLTFDHCGVCRIIGVRGVTTNGGATTENFRVFVGGNTIYTKVRFGVYHSYRLIFKGRASKGRGNITVGVGFHTKGELSIYSGLNGGGLFGSIFTLGVGGYIQGVG